MNRNIHSWDRDAFSKALIWSVLVESISIAPLAISGMGHAGPNGILGWLSLLFNFLGFIPAVWLSSGIDMSWAAFIAIVFLFQTPLLCYLIFVYFRWRKILRKRGMTIHKNLILIAAIAFLVFPSKAVESSKRENRAENSKGVIKALVTGTLQFENGRGYFISVKSTKHSGWNNRVWLAVSEDKIMVRQLQGLEGKSITVKGELEQMPANVQAAVPVHGMYLRTFEIEGGR